MKRAALHNLGCKVNAYETDAMQQILEDNGYQIVDFKEEADVYIINTCSVTNIADRKSRQMIHKAKKKNPDSIVVAAGCYVQTASDRSDKEENDLENLADILIGNNKKNELIPLLEAYYKENKKNELISDMEHETTYESMMLSTTKEHTRGFVKVQDGCNQFCSYCVIPYARGRVRSRKVEEVIEEVEKLSEHGCKEVVLTGIHLSSYGTDTNDSNMELLSLIQKVHEVQGIARIRLGSLEPKIVTEEFASSLAKLEKVCPHFHLSLQSGCDTTLKRMNRRYTCAEYKRGCNILRKYFDHPAITTDVIVGFPGETQEEFEITRKFVQEIGFFEVHIFKYSLRKGTKAAEMKEQIPEEIKTLRSSVLSEEVKVAHDKFIKWYHGMELEGLIEEKKNFGKKEYFVGHTKEYVKIFANTKENLENKLVTGIGKYQEEKGILLLENVLTKNMD